MPKPPREREANWGVLVTARLKSTRLTRKVLRNLNGQPMIWHVLKRMQMVNGEENVVVITSDLPSDDDLAECVERIGCSVFRGDPDDVMKRMLDAATFHGFMDFISVTADNPFADPVYARALMHHHKEQYCDFSEIEGLPFGMFTYAVNLDGLTKAVLDKETSDTEVWGGYFRENTALRCSVMTVSRPEHRRPELRLTVDEQPDFDLIDAILKRSASGIPNIDDILCVIDRCPELLMINKHVTQKVAPKPKIIATKDV